jgi:hypothetical protein
MGLIHAFCMQLVANRILQLRISNKKKHLIGKPELLPHSVTVQLGVVEGETCALIDSYWEGIRVVANKDLARNDKSISLL